MSKIDVLIGEGINSKQFFNRIINPNSSKIETLDHPLRINFDLIHKICSWQYETEGVKVILNDAILDAASFEELFSDDQIAEIEDEMIAIILDRQQMDVNKYIRKTKKTYYTPPNAYHQMMLEWSKTPLDKKLEFIGYSDYLKLRILDNLVTFKK